MCTWSIYVKLTIKCWIYSSVLPAMGHWHTCPPPLDFQQFNFSGHFRVIQTPTTPCGCLSSRNIQTYSFVAVYGMNFIIFLCVTLKLSSLSFVPPRTKSWRCHWIYRNTSANHNPNCNPIHNLHVIFLVDTVSATSRAQPINCNSCGCCDYEQTVVQ